MIAPSALPCRPTRCRKMTMRGHGSMAGGTTSDMPPPPVSEKLGRQDRPSSRL